jgi:hypothetical protein
MEFKHEKFGKCELVDVNQKELEDFMREMKGKENEPLSVWRGESVRASARLGILVEPALTEADVNASKPGLVRWLSDCINEMLAEAMSIDPLS